MPILITIPQMGNEESSFSAGKESAGSAVRNSGSAVLAVCTDGYLRLTLAGFRSICLRHLLSELDEDVAAPGLAAAGASAASIMGFTEWTSDTTPAVSLGWDWRLDTEGSEARYVREGEVRSNIMLFEPGIGDLGDLATSATLCAAVDVLAWQAETHNHITKRYG